ncbi:MAG: phage tail sheath family protein [Anaerolineae bacterium]|nr:phage tail sheath family protein [Anaerolineae bacterium]
MPVTPTYPGVYIEEIPSGVRTITGVATSITAFVGRTLRGPTDEPTTINGFADFERVFGGLWTGSWLGYAVRDFYLNGGSQAIIVRLYHPDPPPANGGGGGGGAPPPPAKTAITVGGLTFEAAYPGSWGQRLRVRLDNDVSADVAASMGLTKGDLFNLTVVDTTPGGRTEQYRNLTLKDTPVGTPRRVDRVLAAQSRLLHWKGSFPSTPPAMPSFAADVIDPVSKAEKDLADKLRANPTDPATAERAALTTALNGAAASDGGSLNSDDFIGAGKAGAKQGLYALEKADLFNLLVIPPYTGDPPDVDDTVVAAAAAYCELRRAMLLVDPKSAWTDKDAAKAGVASVATNSRNAALFFPRLRQPDPLRDDQKGNFAPSGAVAGVFARTDTARGVWKAPAGLDASLVGVPELSVPLTDPENGELNPLGINCLRALPAAGRVVWGSRTLQGDDRLASEWKYVPVRRLALYLEESLYRGTQWVVFEPNDEPLWAQIRLNVGAFMQSLFRQGAFQGRTPREAYFVKCDKETTTQDDINRGVVNIVVGFAPLKPAEFVIIQLQQMAGQIAT